MIELKNITVSYSNAPVLKDISLTFPEEGCVALQGPSGCGKTTLLRVLAGLTKSDAGEILGLSDRKISMVFQEDRLLPWYSAKENIALISDEDVAAELLSSVGLADDLDTLPDALSGGMRRRVAIARALAYSNDVLLLDEPFNGLDPALRASVASLIRERSRLIILVTHDADDADLLGQTVSYRFTADGRIVRDS